MVLQKELSGKVTGPLIFLAALRKVSVSKVTYSLWEHLVMNLQDPSFCLRNDCNHVAKFLTLDTRRCL